ncbi:phosphoribosylformylglycinamidine synthase subunit PurL [Planctomycetales bacterium]|nr:phosphoribosylformylglycinamidine synthase subunit PurL [Planctomycetales bacterium]
MDTYRLEIAVKDAHDEALARELRGFNLPDLAAVREIRVYTVAGDFSLADAARAAREFFADAVVDIFAVNAAVLDETGQTILEIRRKNGVMNPAEQSIKRGLQQLGLRPDWVRQSRKYLLAWHNAAPDLAPLKNAVEKLLANVVIEEFFIGENAPSQKPVAAPYVFKKVSVPLAALNDDELVALSRRQQLYMSLAEMKRVQQYFAELGRDPTDIELETVAQTWSEHCGHKTFKGLINYTDATTGETRVIDNLLKSTVARVTRELSPEWCWSVFVDNSGVIEFTPEMGVGFKVETHNHPSAIEPYGGAGTGIGGCIRDPMGTGLGGQPILNTDVFCFGLPDLPDDQTPRGCLHPRRIMNGVIAGVRDYGNRMGIPTANGALLFDERYTGNPLVFCGNLALIPKKYATRRRPVGGELVIVVGGGTGRDGIHGATFSSVELDENSEMVSSGAVQIGNPIEQKKVLDFLLRARDAELYSALTDCGAGGLSSAVGEMGEECGVEVDLDKAPLKYAGLNYTEIWISEAQERMVISANEKNLAALQKLADEENVTLAVIGKFRADKKLRLRYQGKSVGELTMDFLHDGCPRRTLTAKWEAPALSEPVLPDAVNYGAALKKILAAWNVCSKEWVIRQYDHEVQGASVIKPLGGAAHDSPNDAAVIAPLLGQTTGLAVANGINPKYSDIDPYWMAANAIDEALRNLVAVGGSLDRCALLDNFCWGNCDKPDRLAGLVRAAQACYDIAKIYGVPFVSGKDSLNNEYGVGERTICIPGTLLISAMAVMPDCRRAVSADLKNGGNYLYIVGDTRNELGGSHFYATLGVIGKNVPLVNAAANKKVFTALAAASTAGLCKSMHDCAEGGLAVAAAEMAFGGGLGATLDLSNLPPVLAGELTTAQALFSESSGRLLVEVTHADAYTFEQLMKRHGASCAHIGGATLAPELRVYDAKKNLVLSENIGDLKAAWQEKSRVES